ncbi:MAG: 2Fe-2S iron-sulfur cluster-binding protein, partial [Actinomadura sp.]
MKQTFELIVNGDLHEVACAPDTTLLHVLRHRLDLKGTRFGCGTGLCGACFVLLDGHPTPSCDTPMWAAAGSSVVTVEGLADGAAPNPLQRAFLDEQAAQCGFCISGILISATGLLAGDARPDEQAVRAALDRNLCRCGVHERITAAVLRATADAAPLTGTDAADPLPGGPPAAAPVGLPRGLTANPRLSRWVGVAPDGTVTMRVGKVELGQGIVTALAQLAADELDVDLARLRMVPASTAEGPDEGLTAGSMSVADSGAAVRQACAEVRALFVAEAVATLALDPATVTVRDGVIGDASGRCTTYGDLAARVDLDRDATGAARPKAMSELRLVGTSVPRLDLPDKITGRPRYIHDLGLPGQLAGRVVRPPAPQATLVELDTKAVAKLPGVVSVVRDGGFLGVVAVDEEAAEHAATALADAARWVDGPPLPDEDDLPRVLREGPTELTVVDESGPPPDTAGQVVRRLRASYSRPFLAHASMAPSCAVARWDDGDTVRVWSHSQGIHALRRAIATVLGLDDHQVTVQHVEGAGAYGHNGADDAAFDAVLLARAVPGRPVQVRWSRQDELAWSPFGSAMAVDV